MVCKHLKNDICGIASLLANCDVPTTHQHCQFCSGLEDARDKNKLTVSLALNAASPERKQEIINQYSYFLTEYPEGPGTELKKLISWFWWPRKRCEACSNRVRKMNKWGTAKCWKKRWLIVQWLRQSAEKHGLPFSAFAAGALVDFAIANAEKKNKKSIIQRMEVPSQHAAIFGPMEGRDG